MGALGFEILKWLIAGLSLTGVVLNIRHHRSCFLIWTATNASWVAIDLWHGIWSQATLQAAYCGLAVYGYRAWRKANA
jgi:hypothetical protein